MSHNIVPFEYQGDNLLHAAKYGKRLSEEQQPIVAPQQRQE